MSQTYFALLTAVGEAKLANAAALGNPLQISRMAVGDGNGNLPTPNRLQTALLNEQYRADLNELKIDPNNASQIIAELVIPETEGGWWLREMGLYDNTGALIAVANCPPSYKPQMAEGSGRTQVLRMVLIVSSTAAVQLKIDPSIVLATRAHVEATVVAALAGHTEAEDPHPQYKTTFASQAEAEAATNNSKAMSPLRVLQLLRAVAAKASETLRGSLRIATQAETNAGTEDDLAVTPKKLRAGFASSFGLNGYLALPAWLGGFTMQWGYHPSGTATQNFPIPFPTQHFITVGSATTVMDADLEVVSYDQDTLTGFRYNGDAGRFIALGR